jgi:predicted RND superfamily exporter protein
MELKDATENLFINLKQGNELNKYIQIHKIEAIPHLTQLQKTSDVKLSNVDFNNKNYHLLDNYKKVDDFKSYSQTKDLFNKSVSEYMLAKDYYIETKDSDLFDTLETLKQTIIGLAEKLKNSLNSLIIEDSKTKNNIKYEESQINYLIYSLSVNDNKNIIDYESTNKKLNDWLTINIVGIVILLIIIYIIRINKSQNKDNLLTSGFIFILIVLIYRFRHHII